MFQRKTRKFTNQLSILKFIRKNSTNNYSTTNNCEVYDRYLNTKFQVWLTRLNLNNLKLQKFVQIESKGIFQNIQYDRDNLNILINFIHHLNDSIENMHNLADFNNYTSAMKCAQIFTKNDSDLVILDDNSQKVEKPNSLTAQHRFYEKPSTSYAASHKKNEFFQSANYFLKIDTINNKTQNYFQHEDKINETKIKTNLNSQKSIVASGLNVPYAHSNSKSDLLNSFRNEMTQTWHIFFHHLCILPKLDKIFQAQEMIQSKKNVSFENAHKTTYKEKKKKKCKIKNSESDEFFFLYGDFKSKNSNNNVRSEHQKEKDYRLESLLKDFSNIELKLEFNELYEKIFRYRSIFSFFPWPPNLLNDQTKLNFDEILQYSFASKAFKDNKITNLTDIQTFLSQLSQIYFPLIYQANNSFKMWHDLIYFMMEIQWVLKEKFESDLVKEKFYQVKHFRTCSSNCKINKFIKKYCNSQFFYPNYKSKCILFINMIKGTFSYTSRWIIHTLFEYVVDIIQKNPNVKLDKQIGDLLGYFLIMTMMNMRVFYSANQIKTWLPIHANKILFDRQHEQFIRFLNDKNQNLVFGQ